MHGISAPATTCVQLAQISRQKHQFHACAANEHTCPAQAGCACNYHLHLVELCIQVRCCQKANYISDMVSKDTTVDLPQRYIHTCLDLISKAAVFSAFWLCTILGVRHWVEEVL